jgi:hypothetical protein
MLRESDIPTTICLGSVVWWCKGYRLLYPGRIESLVEHYK